MSCICANEIEYDKSQISYGEWEEQKLKEVTSFIHKILEKSTKKTIIILEVGHFKIPVEHETFSWAKQNLDFSNKLTGNIIKQYKNKFKIIPTLLINNLDDQQNTEVQKILETLLKGNKYITPKSINLLSEKNLKNRAYKALKNNQKLSDSFIHIDGKAYLKDEEYQHDLAAGFVSDTGDIIPRCGLILTSFLDKITDLALQRMHQTQDLDILFVSFSQEFFEFERVKLGVDIYTSTHERVTITPLLFHWNYSQNQCKITHRKNYEKKWYTIN
ncbi:MAG: hypothetical protein K0U47_05040 [Epsilonproteobacteria bacterium]|nr:hypothetical protein [Campylobacterota bacterium]